MSFDLRCEDCRDLVPADVARESGERYRERPLVLVSEWSGAEAKRWTVGRDGRYYCSTCLAKHTVKP